MINRLSLPASSASHGNTPLRKVLDRTLGRKTLSPSSLPYLIVAFLVLLGWIGYEHLFPVPVFPVDDAYIVIHNAQVLLSGSDPNYAGSSPLTGTTSIVHLAFVSALMLLLKPVAALSASLWISGLLYALGLVRLARVNGLSQVMSVLVAVVGTVAGQTPHHLMNGLETGLMLAAVTWALTLLSRPEQQTPSKQQTPWVLPALCGTLPFIRPDLLPLALLFLALHLGRRWRQRRDVPAFCRRAGLDIGIAILFALPWAFWYFREIGSVFPSTLSAKRFFFAEANLPAEIKIAMVEQGLSQFAAGFGLMVVFSVFLVTTCLGRIGITYGGILVAAYYAQFPGALGHYEGRYLFPLLPFLLLGIVYALRWPKAVLRRAAILVFAFSFGQSLVNAPGFWAANMAGCRFTTHDLDGVSDWCNRNLPAHSTLLVHDAGYISCKTRFPLVDFVGLKTPSSVPTHAALTYPSCGRDRCKAISQIALHGNASYLVMLEGWDRIFSVVAGLRAAGWQVRLINADYAYKVYALRPPETSYLSENQVKKQKLSYTGSASTARSISSRVL